MKRSILFSSVFILTVVLCQPVYAAEDFKGGPWEKLSVSLGGIGALSSSDVRIGTNVLGAGVDIDVEEALGLSTSQGSYRISALYRIGDKRRNMVRLTWFEFKRDGTAVAQERHEIGDIIINPGDTVNTTYNTGYLKADYSYSFFMDDRFNLAVSGGLYVMPIKLSVDAAGVGEEETNITAPLPVVGLNFDFAFSPKWILRQNIDFFYLEIGNYKGAIADFNIAIEWNVWEHWGFGAGVDSFRLGIEAQDEGEDVPGVDFAGSIKTNYLGLMLYVKYRF